MKIGGGKGHEEGMEVAKEGSGKEREQKDTNRITMYAFSRHFT